MYVCGPTVYDAPHIGNARTAVVFDTIRRYLEWAGLDVTYVSNVTDVEDKIIARAAREGRTEPERRAASTKPCTSTRWHRLNVREADHRPARHRVHRPHARPHRRARRPRPRVRGAGPGRLLRGRDLPGLRRAAAPHARGAARVGRRACRRRRGEAQPDGLRALEGGQARRAGVGLAVGRGPAGWHIECSAMSLDLLGEGFDLHGGGEDLVFPHHENERAQAEGAGHPFARHWIHIGMVTIGGEKMSKSLGNFTTVDEALADYDARARPAGHAPDALPARRRPRSRGARRRGQGGRAPRRAVPARRRRGRRRRLDRRCRDARPVPRRDGRRLRHRARAGGASSRRRGDANRSSTTATTPGRRTLVDRGRGAERRPRPRPRRRRRRRPTTTTRRSTRSCASRDEARAAQRLRARRPVRDELAAAASSSRTRPAAPSGTDERPRPPRRPTASAPSPSGSGVISGSRSRGGGRCGSSWSPARGRSTTSGSRADAGDAPDRRRDRSARRGCRRADPAGAGRPDRAPGPHRARPRASSRSRRRCRRRPRRAARRPARVPRRARRRHRSAEPRRGDAQRRDRGRDRAWCSPPTAPSASRPRSRRPRPARSSTCRRVRVRHPGRARPGQARRRVVRRARRRRRPSLFELSGRRRTARARARRRRSRPVAPRAQRCDVVASIPMHGHIESLNVSAAAAVACTEIARRRAG